MFEVVGNKELRLLSRDPGPMLDARLKVSKRGGGRVPHLAIVFHGHKNIEHDVETAPRVEPPYVSQYTMLLLSLDVKIKAGKWMPKADCMFRVVTEILLL